MRLAGIIGDSVEGLRGSNEWSDDATDGLYNLIQYDFRIRKRNLPTLSEEELDSRATLLKEWTRFRHQQALADLKTIDRLAHTQTKALDELRLESEELYQKAIQVCVYYYNLIPI